jgi:hypothetical protein
MLADEHFPKIAKVQTIKCRSNKQRQKRKEKEKETKELLE